MFWLGYTVQWNGDLAGSLSLFTELRDAVADRGPSRALADGYETARIGVLIMVVLPGGRPTGTGSKTRGSACGR
jgi:hypothetical protein